MLSIANILVPVVFSDRCAWSARFAARLAYGAGSQVIALHVSKKNLAGELEAFARKELGNVPHKSLVLDGDPADRIIEFARESRADLIVMPTYHARYRTFLIGSITAKVLHDVECPVLTGVHGPGASFQIPEAFRNIVCGLDDSPGCVSLFHWVRDLTSILGARLRLVHALPAVNETSENRGEIEVRRYLLNEARKNFHTCFASEPEEPAVDLRGGEIARVLREAALVDHADIVVIGRGHADRALGRLRTHTYAVIRNSPCPVLSV